MPCKWGTVALFRLYTGGMAQKQTTGRDELAELLKLLRGKARMTRGQLAAASAGEVSVGPIKRIELEGYVPKARTLEAIAKGLATYAEGRRDDELAADYYDQLMRAAGYRIGARPTETPPPTIDTRAAVRRDLQERYGEDDQFVAAVLDKLATEPEERRQTILGLLLGGIGNSLGRPHPTRDLQFTR